MLNAFKQIQKGEWKTIKSGMSYPLVRWFSGSQTLLLLVNKINKAFFFIPETMKYGWLSIYGPHVKGFIRYPKGSKATDQWKAMVVACKKLYGWSERECKINRWYVDGMMKDKASMQQLADMLGWDNKERRLFKLDTIKVGKIKPVKIEVKKKKEVTVFDF